MDGIARVVVGYSGGKELNPTYRNIKDATESVLLEYDPNVMSYERILDEWARQHFPQYRYPSKAQYRSAVFYRSEGQKVAALSKLKSLREDVGGGKLYIDVEPVTPFYKAEEYHQDYIAKATSERMAY